MSVVEFSADAWQASSPGLQEGLARRIEALDALAQGLEALAASENISGQGADAMRAYIREVHIPIMQTLLISLSTFQTAIGKYWDGYNQVDTNGNFRLVKDEHDAHLTQLERGMEQLRGYGTDLRKIASDASHLVPLGGAGAAAAEQATNDLQQMHSIAKGQKEAWEAYEASDPGFAQVKNLIAELNNIVKNVGTLTVGQGRSYTVGSFNLSFQKLGELSSGMLDYCDQNRKIASAGWESMFSEYTKDVEAARKEQAAWDLIWDGLQIAAGVLILAVGVVGTPFSAGATLTLAALGGSLIVGGVNSAINNVSIAASGQELNLVGMVSDTVGGWYDVSVMQPAVESGSWVDQFVAGFGSGVGQVVSGAAQMNVRDMGRGLDALIFDEGARNQAWKQVTTYAGQVMAGEPVAIGQLAGNLLPGAAALKIARTSTLFSQASKLPDFGTPVITNASMTTSALDWGKSLAGAGAATIRKTTDAVKHALDGATNPHGVGRGGGMAPTRLTATQQALVDQLVKAGEKIDPGKVLDIWKTPEGKVVWYDQGKATVGNKGGAGLTHIEEHADDFAKKGIPREELPDAIKKAINENNVVAHQGSGTGRPVYRVEANGRTVDIAITVSKNGYIVGANPTSKFGN